MEKSRQFDSDKPKRKLTRGKTPGTHNYRGFVVFKSSQTGLSSGKVGWKASIWKAWHPDTKKSFDALEKDHILDKIDDHLDKPSSDK